MAQSWYIARTEPLGEYIARDRLQANGVEVYLPCVSNARPRPGCIDAPLFPGFVFLRYDLEQWGWPRRLFQESHLVGLVGFGQTAAKLEDEIISDLASRVEAINQNGGLRSPVRAGDRVNVRLGSIDQCPIAVVTEVTPEAERARVLFDFLGLQILAEVPWEDIQPNVGEGAPALKGVKPPRRTRGRGRWIRGFGPGSREAGVVDSDSL